MKYMIHACNQRMWYVERYLLPSLLEQGIQEKDIYVHQDKSRAGNLVSWVVSCHLAYDMWGHAKVWHLQDDVILASYFKQMTEELEEKDTMIICGFTCKYDDNRAPGGGTVIKDMWYSFPCIRLDSKLTKEFADWADRTIWKNNQEFGFWVREKKGDDWVFRVFLEENYPNSAVLNLSPNLVDHIDYLINGSIVNPTRKQKDVRSLYWNEDYLIENLKRRLENED